ncbi:MAG: DPP IV N-terminal domain-containing protein, partial [Chloroflexota bacterium]
MSALLLGGAVASGRLWLHGDEIAYVSYRELNPDIYLMDVGHELTFNMSHDPGYDVAPAWSPDGEWLAFASDRDGRRNIYVMDRVGGSIHRLTNQGGIYSQPRWSSDG